jgi:hypothetical protein
MTMADKDQLAAFLRGFLPTVPGFSQFGTPVNPYAFRPLETHYPPAAEELAERLMKQAEFRALGLGAFLSTPDGEMIAAAVGEVITPPFQPYYTLVVTALQLAAHRQQQHGRERAAGLTGAGMLLTLLLLAILKD